MRAPRRAGARRGGPWRPVLLCSGRTKGQEALVRSLSPPVDAVPPVTQDW